VSLLRFETNPRFTL